MSTQVLPEKISAAALPGMGGVMRYVARQPILDLHSRVHGYELLFRAGPDTAFRGDGDLATRTILDNTVIFGLDKLTGGLPAFVNCTLESLTDELVQVLPSSMTVLEILENLEPTPELIKACGKLKRAGFRLALDDFTWSPKFEPLVELADYIKVDFMLTSAAERKRLLKRLDGFSVALIAEKVETQEEYKQACDEGFTLFQGYYFCRPLLLQNRKVPSNRLSQIEILQLLRGSSIELKKLARLVKRDASLTYRLLRLVNSPMCAVRQEVSSIESALLAVGEDTFRRIATLAITSEFSAGQPAEILRMAFVRGKFCEDAAGLCGLDATEQYLLGLLSLLPAMLRLPMADLTPALPLRLEIRQALESAGNSERRLLAWLEFHEHGNWAASDEAAAAYGLDSEQLLDIYTTAVLWAEEALRFAV
jgi:c-di-GMP phosphodiesterase